MTEEQYLLKRRIKLAEIERNERIHCHLVAARHRRELQQLDEQYRPPVSPRGSRSVIPSRMRGISP